MAKRILKAHDEITPESLYLRRREFIKNGALAAATAAGVGGALGTARRRR